jgi:hypothetical protein
MTATTAPMIRPTCGDDDEDIAPVAKDAAVGGEKEISVVVVVSNVADDDDVRRSESP